MQINLGTNASTNEPVIWNSDDVINGHIMLVGMSGSGKSVFIREILDKLEQGLAISNDFKCHIFDVHDDLEVEGSSSVLFSEQCDYGMNPLVINPDPDYGGIRKTISNFIMTVNKTSHKIGHRQENVMRKLIIELYNSNGFFEDSTTSWTSHGEYRGKPKRYPTLMDLKRWTNFKLRKMYTGADGQCAQALDDLQKSTSALHRTIMKNGDASLADASHALDKKKKDCIAAFTDYLDSIKTGKELDELMKYQSKETLHSLLDIIDKLIATGIFKSTMPPFDYNSKFLRYRIKPLGEDERKMFTLFRLRSIFRDAMAQGVKDYIDTVLILDEAHIYLDNDEDNIVNIISKEARKFGIMLIVASQSPKHYPDTFLSSIATKIILGIDELHWPDAVRKMGMTLQQLKSIRFYKQIMIQIKQRGKQRGEFVCTKRNPQESEKYI